MIIKTIRSKSNTVFRLFLKLLNVRGIKKHCLALLSGPKQVKEVLQEFPDRCRGIISSDSHAPPIEYAADGITLYNIRTDMFRQIDVYNTGHPLLLVSVEPFPVYSDEYYPAGCSLFIPFQDPANVGALIRSSAAFGVSRVIMLKEAAHPFHPKSVRVAGSCLFRVPVFSGPSLFQLNVSKTPVITLSAKGTDVDGFRFPHTFCLVPGMEGPGLPSYLMKATCLSIPMERDVESLNAALTTGIVLYLWRTGLNQIRSSCK
ncbi:MAG: RNA methyltransferase [Deltaproteobacteria bacterium]|nr:RNA methyltransferase [Deltaproteobacteria bacterium]